MNDKIQQHHLDRAAYVYVRQSTNHQVHHNHQGRQRQYDLAARAKEFSFSSVVVIDDDQGKSGSGLVERPGFQTLLTAVCGSEVGRSSRWKLRVWPGTIGTGIISSTYVP